MRLAFLTTHPIQYQAPLFRSLARRPGVELTVLFCHDHGVNPTYDAGYGLTIKYDVPLLEGYRYRFLRNVAPRPALSFSGLVNPEIISILGRHEFDAIVVHGYAYVTALMAFGAPRDRTRLLLRGDSSVGARPRLARAFVKHFALRRFFRRVDHFLAIGSQNRGYYESYGVAPERITFAAHSVDNAYFTERSQEARRDPVAARREFGLPEGGVLFVFAGKMLPKKRPFDLLDGFARAGLGRRAVLAYVGDGPLAADLEARVRSLGLGETVRLLGFRNQSELPRILGACDALVLPSDFEPWGLIVNEAMACGATAVVSDCVGAWPDLLEPEHVFPVGDVDRLAEILRALALGPEAELRRIQSRAFERIAAWGIEQTADGVLRGVDTALRS
jgi:glycosyltransferase involved in cell wall biosynthesis